MHHIPYRTRFAPIAMLLAWAAPAALPAHAADTSFDHEDWQLVCDNTRTCRVAGYQSDDAGMPVSVLFTRKAGAGTAVAGRVALGDGWEDSVLDALPAQFRVALWIDGKHHGERTVTKDALEAMTEAFGVEPINKGEGGSIPFIPELQRIFPNAQVLVSGPEDPKANAHSPNESISLPGLKNNVITEALLLDKLGK